MKRIYENLGVRDGTIRFLGIWDTLLDKGVGITPHLHEDVEEVYYILEGSGEVRIGDEVTSVSNGDIIYIPPRKIHTLIQHGDKMLRFITVSIDTSQKARSPPSPPYVA